MMKAIAASVILLIASAGAVKHYQCKELQQSDVARVVNLLNASNNSEIKAIKDTFAQGQWQQAAEDLIAYYRNGQQGFWFRNSSQPTPSSRMAGGDADRALNNNYSVYTETAVIPSGPDGSLDWSFQGPLNDPEFKYHINRHEYVNTIHDAWRATGNDIYLQLYGSLLCDWVYHVPEPSKPTPHGLWRTLDSGNRMVRSWVPSYFRFISAPNLTTNMQMKLLWLLNEHGDFLSKYSYQGYPNWQSSQWAGLGSIAATIPEFNNAGQWFDATVAGIRSDIVNNTYPDGMENEQSVHYHLAALINFDIVANLSKFTNRSVDPAIASRLEKMFGYIVYSMDPTGVGPLNSDSDWVNNSAMALSAAHRFDRPDWLYVATNGREGTKPSGTLSTIYPWSGQLIMRSGYDINAWWSWFDLGAWSSSGHGHFDKLHLSIRGNQEQYLVDSGRFAYSGEVGQEFHANYGQHTRGHNVMLIDEQNQDQEPRVATEPLRAGCNYSLGSDGNQGDWGFGSIVFPSAKGHVMHSRGLLHVAGKAWVVVDRVDTDRTRNVKSLWHTHPNVSTSKIGDDMYLINGTNGGLVMMAFQPQQSSWQLNNASLVRGRTHPTIQGWYSRGYSVFTQSTCIEHDYTLPSSDVLGWLIIPFSHPEPYPAISASFVDVASTKATVKYSARGVESVATVYMACQT
eukprot:TRINITY_DN6544_c0_g1_i1.p1 TRINITY_DN6544_c0_g1~~TRINITY_DN6544_c0_g1_i1.p1  ORF type:complete len:682 (+),score=152.90 TRINITY_DN6544_c0_g1_i1:1116-3161(+)